MTVLSKAPRLRRGFLKKQLRYRMLGEDFFTMNVEVKNRTLTFNHDVLISLHLREVP